jgi:hypothetical protein
MKNERDRQNKFTVTEVEEMLDMKDIITPYKHITKPRTGLQMYPRYAGYL